MKGQCRIYKEVAWNLSAIQLINIMVNSEVFSQAFQKLVKDLDSAKEVGLKQIEEFMNDCVFKQSINL